MILNLNDKIKVKLTNYGKTILKNHHYNKILNPDENDEIITEVWKLFSVYGSYCFNKDNLPFYSDNLEILDDK